MHMLYSFVYCKANFLYALSTKKQAKGFYAALRPSSLGGGRILRRTLSVRLSVCLSVRPCLVG